MPAEKGGLRTVDVSVSVCSLVDLSLNFTMVMGSFTQKHVLIQSDQSERGKVYGPILTDQSGSREGMYGHKLTNQREGRVCRVKG